VRRAIQIDDLRVGSSGVHRREQPASRESQPAETAADRRGRILDCDRARHVAMT
jgi:hypothetical protein